MLDNLTARLAKIVKTIRGEARLTEANVQEALAFQVEEAARSPIPEMPPGWNCADVRLYGDTRVLLYEVAG